MVTMLPKAGRRFSKGQADHVDAWLISYADMITLLFMFFMIFVSAVYSEHAKQMILTRGEPPHPYVDPHHYGMLELGTIYDEVYRNLMGVVVSDSADQYIAVQKTDRGLMIDISAVRFFERSSSAIPKEEMPTLMALAHILSDPKLEGYTITVEGYTDDGRIEDSHLSNSWELGAMRAARVVHLLVDQGIDASRLRAISFGDTHPLVPNRDAAGNPIPENRARNQRVVIRVEMPAT